MKAITRFLIAAAGLVPAAAVFSQDRDYEAEARALYAEEPGYEKQWPVEFHVRVLEPLMQDLARTAHDLDQAAPAAFLANDAQLVWFVPNPGEEVGLGVRVAHWDPEPKNTSSFADYWLSTLTAYQWVEISELKIKKLRLEPWGATAWVKQNLAGRQTDGRTLHQQGRFRFELEKSDGTWKVRFAEMLDHTTIARDAPMFTDVTDQLVPERFRTRSSSDRIHKELLDGKESRLQPVAMDAHPGVAVYDDTLFLWDVTGPGVFLKPVELHVENVSAAAFGDLNNDGLTDAVIGHWLEPSRIYLATETGFEPVAEGPQEVATISLVDVNRDGLLDVFFGTSAHDYHGRAVAAGTAGPNADANVNQIGPLNVLLVNKGEDGFEDQSAVRGLTQRRNTLQAAFADYNEDGWPDVFLGNDFAPANMLVSERGVFKDVSRETGASQIYFGMGASWGDFDNDGDLDLYASAMASSAGQRIMSEKGNFDKGLLEGEIAARLSAARGNTLLRNDGDGKLTDVTATPAFAPARNANWAYGAQFFDADNDGFLDVYSPNGFFTPSGLRPEQTVRDL